MRKFNLTKTGEIIMKKTALIIALTAAMCAFVSCDKEEVVSSVPDTLSASVTTAAVSSTAETTASEPVTTVTAAASGTTTAADTITANTDNIDDLTGLSGYWYANGDPKAAFLHITKDGKFKEYNSAYGATMFYSGDVKRELDIETNSYFYCMYLDTGELYKRFADNGEKSEINFEDGDVTNYVKLYDEGGIDDDGRSAEEIYTGSWICGRAIIEISSKGEGVFKAQVTWSSSAAAHVLWNYPLVLDNGKLVCSGNGKKAFVEFKEGETVPTETVEYTDGSAEFTIEGNHLFWNNFNEHDADKMLFEKNS